MELLSWENLLQALKCVEANKGSHGVDGMSVKSLSMKNNGKHEVCFNVQTVVDSKYKLIVDCDTVNDVNDQGQLSNMAKKTKQVFYDQKITILADTGYYNYLEIIDVVDENTELLIKPQKGKQNKDGLEICC